MIDELLAVDSGSSSQDVPEPAEDTEDTSSEEPMDISSDPLDTLDINIPGPSHQTTETMSGDEALHLVGFHPNSHSKVTDNGYLCISVPFMFSLKSYR